MRNINVSCLIYKVRHYLREMVMVSSLTPGGALLFVPGNRPDRFNKAAACKPDHVIVDLEDAVPPGEKAPAREHARRWLRSARALVRVNEAGSPWHDDDLQMASRSAAGVVLPKAESPEVVKSVVGRCDVPVFALIESPQGVLEASRIARAGVAGLMFGNVDFAADAGVQHSSHTALLVARSTLVYASAAAGISAPVDGVTTQIDAPDILEADLQHAREVGFAGRLCIHPRQVSPTQAAFLPTEAELKWAAAVLRAGDGVSVVSGEMVDPPVLTRARSILARGRKGSGR